MPQTSEAHVWARVSESDGSRLRGIHSGWLLSGKATGIGQKLYTEDGIMHKTLIP